MLWLFKYRSKLFSFWFAFYTIFQRDGERKQLNESWDCHWGLGSETTCPCTVSSHHLSSWLRRQPAHQPRTLFWSISTPSDGFFLHLQATNIWVCFCNSIHAICKTKYASHKYLHKAELQNVAGCGSVVGTKGTRQATDTEAWKSTK